jgi:hypothetical protein
MRADRSTSPVRDTARRRWWPGALVTVAAAALAVLAAPAPAALAHDELVGISPAQGATVATASAQVELVMSAPPQALGTDVLVTGADGAAVPAGTVEVRGTTVVAPLPADLPAGTYTVAWRVISSDGHPLAGTSTFTLAAEPAAPETADAEPAAPGVTDPKPAPVDEVAASGSALAAAGQDGGSSPSPAVLAGGIGLLVLAAGLGARQLRRRS